MCLKPVMKRYATIRADHGDSNRADLEHEEPASRYGAPPPTIAAMVLARVRPRAHACARVRAHALVARPAPRAPTVLFCAALPQIDKIRTRLEGYQNATKHYLITYAPPFSPHPAAHASTSVPLPPPLHARPLVDE